MKTANLPSPEELEQIWARQNAEWRDQAQVTSQWDEAAQIDPRLLQFEASDSFWQVLDESQATLLVTREYEHLVLALNMTAGEQRVSYQKIPHPSGLAVDLANGVVYIASTRNPNQIFEYAPVSGYLPRQDTSLEAVEADGLRDTLVPQRSYFLPGCLYMHDLALVGRELHANSVGQNAVIRLCNGAFERVWWPKCIEVGEKPVFEQNHIQLNSIAAGSDLASSYFSASTDRPSARRPGHLNFKVDHQGVIFSGASREPLARGLTRPHSARLWQGQVYVDNSGYGELTLVDGSQLVTAASLPGWTRGLAISKTSGSPVAFVGTSQVLKRFQSYAPGLDGRSTLCGVHAVDLTSGQVLGSITWPYGNQVFALELVPRGFTSGFPFQAGRKRPSERIKKLFYTYTTSHHSSKG